MSDLAWNQKLNKTLGLKKYLYFNYLSGSPRSVFWLWREYIEDAVGNTVVGLLLVLTLGSYWCSFFGKYKYGCMRTRISIADTWWGLLLLVEGISVLFSVGLIRVNAHAMGCDTYNKISHFEHTHLKSKGK